MGALLWVTSRSNAWPHFTVSYLSEWILHVQHRMSIAAALSPPFGRSLLFRKISNPTKSSKIHTQPLVHYRTLCCIASTISDQALSGSCAAYQAYLYPTRKTVFWVVNLPEYPRKWYIIKLQSPVHHSRGRRRRSNAPQWRLGRFIPKVYTVRSTHAILQQQQINGTVLIGLTYSCVVQSVSKASIFYRVRLNFRGTKLSRIANLLNIHGFYFRGCWERIDMVDHLVPGKLRN